MPTNLQSNLLLGPTSFDGGGISNLIGPWAWRALPSHLCRRFTTSATINRLQNHYTTLGVSTNASSSDIKKSYRLLALKRKKLDLHLDIIYHKMFIVVRERNITKRRIYLGASAYSLLLFSSMISRMWLGLGQYVPEDCIRRLMEAVSIFDVEHHMNTM
ncbi:uncharacterized protein LOC111380300, partial [Olea europaea var. sylvestris]|uniref:uncharacterized protein LOC111380300 n=1 Tax=Olea europaea var. sylvestris TaxID=158386 RepID=UPI000C1CEECE